ncbi:hypothetical protein JG688_00013734 [Phytophthora aleatoria]|uniref:Uncharacterized protein n=1 Tax=Phytophthora aleatoria TaxID=2496075 RepID=A0A8J5MEA0_9STRA|nr:hypothetical protein JG688_00013734 [Phytophthora aleatoria]
MPSVLVVLLLLLLPSAGAFRVINSSTDSVIGTHAVFEPYEAGYVGYYGDPSNPSAERLNEGSPYSPDTPRIFFSAPLQRMLGPGHNGEFYCFSREYGNCDRRSGLCVCNQGYTGCLTCADLQLNSVRRSGARRIDQPLPEDERLREFSQKFVYGSQDPRVFDEAESFTLAPAAYSSHIVYVDTEESSPSCRRFTQSLKLQEASL